MSKSDSKDDAGASNSKGQGAFGTLTAREQEILLLGMSHLNTQLSINFDELQPHTGLQTVAATRKTIRNAMKKLVPEYTSLPIPGGGEGATKDTGSAKKAKPQPIVVPKAKEGMTDHVEPNIGVGEAANLPLPSTPGAQGNGSHTQFITPTSSRHKSPSGIDAINKKRVAGDSDTEDGTPVKRAKSTPQIGIQGTKKVNGTPTTPATPSRKRRTKEEIEADKEEKEAAKKAREDQKVQKDAAKAAEKQAKEAEKQAKETEKAEKEAAKAAEKKEKEDAKRAKDEEKRLKEEERIRKASEKAAEKKAKEDIKAKKAAEKLAKQALKESSSKKPKNTAANGHIESDAEDMDQGDAAEMEKISQVFSAANNKATTSDHEFDSSDIEPGMPRSQALDDKTEDAVSDHEFDPSGAEPSMPKSPAAFDDDTIVVA